MKAREIEKETRRLYHKIHVAQGDDPKIYARLRRLLTTEYLQVPDDFFHDKICLDAGCGSNANATHALLSMGAKKVYAFDLDNTIVKSAPKYLSEFKGRYELSAGNVMHLDYPSNFFDFVHCSGVLHSIVKPLAGLKELARVTKVGGMFYFTIYGKGGLVREVTTFFREKYVKDGQFRKLIDNLKYDHFLELWKWIAASMEAEGDTFASQIPFEVIESLFDKDMVLTIKDRITTPLYYEFSDEEMIGWLKANGFARIKRLTRNPKIKNIRRLLCPFYHQYDHKFSRLLYGSGFMQFSAIKTK